jgi:hypothetical protein
VRHPPATVRFTEGVQWQPTINRNSNFQAEGMITDIPTHTDYENTGLSLLNLAWETTLNLSIHLDDAKENASETVSEDDYWAASQTQLTTAISLVQQAAEFLLKSRIVAVSPYLLIGGSPREWPKGCNVADMPFADFYSIDAQDLTRAHDTVASARLPDNMKTLFEKMRKLRNSIIHTVDKRLKIEVAQIISTILEISDWFIGPHKWVEIRRKQIKSSSNPIACESTDIDVTIYLLARELMKCVDILKPPESERFLNFDKKQRKYICHRCAYACDEAGLKPNLALLSPNTPGSTRIHCFVCNKNSPVVRKACGKAGCNGNVLDAFDGYCLTCYR